MLLLLAEGDVAAAVAVAEEDVAVAAVAVGNVAAAVAVAAAVGDVAVAEGDVAASERPVAAAVASWSEMSLSKLSSDLEPSEAEEGSKTTIPTMFDTKHGKNLEET